jgi:hypothetical protein
MTNVTATASGGFQSFSVYSEDNCSPTMTNSTAAAWGATENYGVYSLFSSPTIQFSVVSASDGDSYGIHNISGNDTYTATVNGCQIIAATHTILNDDHVDNFTTLVGASLLSGGTVTGTGTITCAGVYDENYAFYATTCP